jgi:hypothetical protein
MKKNKQPDGLAPGVYFGLDEKAYHNDPALSHSGIVSILESERDYYESSPLYEHREFKATEAMKFGTRCHAYLMEPKKFLQTYYVAGSNYSKDKEGITSNEFALIKESTGIIRNDPETSKYFEDGYAEVSIIVVDPATGIRLRIRVDYLRTFGFIDLKRVKSLKTRKIGYDAATYGWDIQDWMYRYVIGLAKQQLKAGKIKAHGEYDEVWLQAFIRDPDIFSRFFMQRSTRPYIYEVWYWDEHILAEAEKDTRDGINIYKAAIEKYGASSWPYGSPKAKKFPIDKMGRRDRD